MYTNIYTCMYIKTKVSSKMWWVQKWRLEGYRNGEEFPYARNEFSPSELVRC